MPILFARPTLGSLSNLAVVLAWLITLYSGTRLWWLAVEGRERVISLTFWLFVYVWLGLGALANTVSQQFPLFNQTFTEETQVSALTTIVVGLAAYEFGRQLCRAHQTTKTAPALLNLPTVSPRRVTILGFLGMCTAVYFTARVGLGTRFSSVRTELFAFLGSADTGTDALGQQNPSAQIQMALDWVTPFVAVYLLLYVLRIQREAQRQHMIVPVCQTWSKAFMLGLAGALILADNPFTNTRYRFGGVAIGLVLVVWPLSNPRRVRVFVTTLLAATLVLFPLANVFRNSAHQTQSASLNAQFRTNADFSMFQQELNAQVYVAHHGHTWGKQLLGTVLSYVPRSVWPGKPISTGNLVLGPYYGTLLPASLSIFGWAFVDGGAVWVFLVLATYGWLSGALEAAYGRRPAGRLSFAGAAAPLFGAFQVILLRGDLQPIAGQLAPIALALIAVCTLSSRSRLTKHAAAHQEV